VLVETVPKLAGKYIKQALVMNSGENCPMTQAAQYQALGVELSPMQQALLQQEKPSLCRHPDGLPALFEGNGRVDVVNVEEATNDQGQLRLQMRVDAGRPGLYAIAFNLGGAVSAPTNPFYLFNEVSKAILASPFKLGTRTLLLDLDYASNVTQQKEVWTELFEGSEGPVVQAVDGADVGVANILVQVRLLSNSSLAGVEVWSSVGGTFLKKLPDDFKTNVTGHVSLSSISFLDALPPTLEKTVQSFDESLSYTSASTRSKFYKLEILCAGVPVLTPAFKVVNLKIPDTTIADNFEYIVYFFMTVGLLPFAANFVKASQKLRVAGFLIMSVFTMLLLAFMFTSFSVSDGEKDNRLGLNFNFNGLWSGSVATLFGDLYLLIFLAAGLSSPPPWLRRVRNLRPS
jgi:hypothetical protein